MATKNGNKKMSTQKMVTNKWLTSTSSKQLFYTQPLTWALFSLHGAGWLCANNWTNDWTSMALTLTQCLL